MKHLSSILSAIALVLPLAHVRPAAAQASPACIAAAHEILTMKHASAMYANAVAGIVQQTKGQLVQQNAQYDSELNQIAAALTQTFAGREKEIGDGMEQIYCKDFSEQDLQEILNFYKSPIGQKLLKNEPTAIQEAMSLTQQWATQFGETVKAQFVAEMKKRGKPISAAPG